MSGRVENKTGTEYHLNDGNIDRKIPKIEKKIYDIKVIGIAFDSSLSLHEHARELLKRCIFEVLRISVRQRIHRRSAHLTAELSLLPLPGSAALPQ